MKYTRTYENFLNKIIRNVKILSIIRYEDKNKLPQFEYQCSCGIVSIRNCVELLNKKDKDRMVYCKCNRKRPNIKLRNYEMTTYNAVYGIYKRGAKRRNLSFDISIEEFIEVINKECYYCGDIQYKNIYLVLNNSFIKNKKGNRSKRSNDFSEEDLQKYTVPCVGIDRKDGSKGYVLENIVPCCSRCNIMKHVLNFEEFYEHITKIHNYKNKRKD